MMLVNIVLLKNLKLKTFIKPVVALWLLMGFVCYGSAYFADVRTAEASSGSSSQKSDSQKSGSPNANSNANPTASLEDIKKIEQSQKVLESLGYIVDDSKVTCANIQKVLWLYFDLSSQYHSMGVSALGGLNRSFSQKELSAEQKEQVIDNMRDMMDLMDSIQEKLTESSDTIQQVLPNCLSNK